MPAFPAASVLAAMLLATGGPDPAPMLTAARVRAESTEVRTLIEATAARSATVRQLITRLGCTDAIVYVEITSSPLVPTARTKLVTTVSSARFIRIGINVAMSEHDRSALLGHELQHALEIAERLEVRDDNGVRRLFRQIGRLVGSDSYETDAARDVEWTVRAELRTKIGG